MQINIFCLCNLKSQLNERNLNGVKYYQKSFGLWGSYTNIANGPSCQVRRLEIKPKASISVQMHKKRSEYWIVIDGKQKLNFIEILSFLKKSKHIYSINFKN